MHDRDIIYMMMMMMMRLNGRKMKVEMISLHAVAYGK